MNWLQKIHIPLLSIIFSLSLLSCKKGWLDAKPQKSLVVPNSIEDYQAMLDNTTNIGGAPMNVNQSIMDEVSAGDFYVIDSIWNASQAFQRNCYIWAEDIYGGETNNEWEIPYKRIFYSNVVLEGIAKIIPIDATETQAWNQVKGSALFFRAYNHYNMAQQFCKAYDNKTSKTDLGIPLRLQSDINIPSTRSSVEQTYEQIIVDLKESSRLLPIATPINDLYKLRPNVAAANAMLARVYLAASNYDSALIYADKCLQAYDVLLNYSNDPLWVNPGGTNPFKRFNPEVLFHMRSNSFNFFLTSRLIVDSTLFNSYKQDDMRRTCFFRLQAGNNTFKGHYEGNTTSGLFTGLATDEVYLIRAECYARRGNLQEALNDINALLQKRWNHKVSFPALTAVDANDALTKIIQERRKELCFRGLRWTDLRRLNKETQYQTTLKRIINGQTYVLAPNDSKYVFPIPPMVIQLTNMPQNPRN